MSLSLPSREGDRVVAGNLHLGDLGDRPSRSVAADAVVPEHVDPFAQARAREVGVSVPNAAAMAGISLLWQTIKGEPCIGSNSLTSTRAQFHPPWPTHACLKFRPSGRQQQLDDSRDHENAQRNPSGVLWASASPLDVAHGPINRGNPSHPVARLFPSGGRLRGYEHDFAVRTLRLAGAAIDGGRQRGQRTAA